MKIRFVVPAVAALAFASIVGAQSAPKSADPAATVKIGVVSVQAAIASTAEGKQAAAELQSQFAPRQKDLQDIQKQIDDLTTRLRTGDATLSDDEKGRLQNQIDQLTRTGQRRQQDLQEDTQAAEQDLINSIGRKLEVVMQKYAQENGYSVILDVGSQQSSVFWYSNAIDVTPQIIQLYDQANPVKTSTTPSSVPHSTTPKSTAPKQ